MFHAHLTSENFLVYMVATSYALWFFALTWMVIQGYRQKSYGMPPLGTAGMLGICVIATVGFYFEPTLFPDPNDPEKPHTPGCHTCGVHGLPGRKRLSAVPSMG